MKFYIICPVRKITPEQINEQGEYVAKLEKEGFEVFYPPRDAPQESKTGYEIVMAELNAIKDCDEVHIFWDINSNGSHFDLGMVIALEKKIKIVKLYQPDVQEKSYMKVVEKYNENLSY